MYLFNDKELNELKQRAIDNSKVIDLLKKDVDQVYSNELKIPVEGIGNWGQYYVCDIHSTPLVFSYNSHLKHYCPLCDKYYEGEPYNSSWWGLMNTRNFQSAYKMALIFIATGDIGYGNRAKEILVKYSEHYPSYAVHGDIPYNGPGKAQAQTLNEAQFLFHFAFVYDLLEAILSYDEKELIKENLLTVGGEFLMQHRHNQIHNHEVLTNAAIGIIGILLNRKDMIDFGVYDKYGLLYQLEHAVLEDDIWFEISFGYQFFALTSFMAYEKFARHTKYSNLANHKYCRMCTAVLNYLDTKHAFPPNNDTKYTEYTMEKYQWLEFVYSIYKDPSVLTALGLCYERSNREDSIEAFFFGEKEIAQYPPLKQEEFVHSKYAGIATLRGKDERMLMIKYGPFGGEHDHYDKLGISYSAFGEKMCSDLGTTGYGAYYHYNYFKNTGSHNTVALGEENQPPTNGYLNRIEKEEDSILIDIGCDWSSAQELPNSFIIKAWNDETYRNAKFRRVLIWTKDYLVDVFFVTDASHTSIDHVLHVDGTLVSINESIKLQRNFSDKKPFKELHNMELVTPENGMVKNTFDIHGKGYLNVFTSVVGCQELYKGYGPNCPSVDDIVYLINRQQGEQAVFVDILETYKENAVIKDVKVDIKDHDVSIEIISDDGTKKHVIKR